MAPELVKRDELASDYRGAADPDHQARHGQVMTPSDVASYMADLLALRETDLLLDPGAGLGILSHAAIRTCPNFDRTHLTQVELDCVLADGLKADPEFHGALLVAGDFFDFVVAAHAAGKRWTRVISNPPYLNFHDFDREILSRLAATLGIRMSKLTNLFALFLLASAKVLAPGGRMVFITPTELFSTNYGRTALQSLPSDVHLTSVTVFEPGAEPFENADTTACVTVFDRRDSPPSSVTVRPVVQRVGGTWRFEPDVSVETRAFKENPRLIISSRARSFDTTGKRALGELVRVSRGIATGDNEFFTVTDDAKRSLDPEGRHFVPVICKAEDLGGGLAFDAARVEELRKAGRRTWLLYLKKGEEISPRVAEYLQSGEAKGVPKRYLCAARPVWYAMEQQKPPSAFLRVFGRDGVKVVMNEAGVRTLACCHRIHHHHPSRISDDGVFLLACYLQSAEGQHSLEAQARRYGSGLQKLEPKDVERAAVPDIARLSFADQAELAQRARTILQTSGQSSATFDSIAASIVSAISSKAMAAPSRVRPITELV